MSNYISDQNMSYSNKAFVNQLFVAAIPNNVHEALVDPKWRKVMNEETDALQKNET